MLRIRIWEQGSGAFFYPGSEMERSGSGSFRVGRKGVGANLDFYLRFPPASAADSHGGHLPHLPVTHIVLVAINFETIQLKSIVFQIRIESTKARNRILLSQ